MIGKIFSKSPKSWESIKGLSFEDCRKRARILVIDDDPDAFPTEILKSEGYNVHYWEKVENLRDLERAEYDIIVLDIHGISGEFVSKDGGIEVLKHIKKYNPAQIVIAYSAKKYDLNQGAFWKLADDLLGKPSTALECKEKIDDLIQTRYSPDYYWSILSKELRKNDISEKRLRKLEKEVLKHAASQKSLDPSKIETILKTTKELVSIASVIVGVIVKLSAP